MINRDSSPSFHLPSALQLGYSLLAILGIWGVAFLVLVFTLVKVGFQFLFTDPFPLLAVGEIALLGFLLFPSAWSAIQRLRGKTPWTEKVDWRRAQKYFWLFPFIWLVGFGISQITGISWLLLPPLHLLGIGLPLLWFISLGGRGLLFSRQRAWGVFGVGLTLSPLIILILELLMGAAALLVAANILRDVPGFQAALEQLTASLQGGFPDMTELSEFAERFLLRGDIITIFLIFIAVLVPFLEEGFKTIGIWALLPRGLSPAAGFLGGMISGAGFALFESLSLGSQGAEWAMLIGARMGTSLVHIFTAGLTGWGLALAWQHDNPLQGFKQLLPRYLLAVLIHGTWNGLTALVVLDSFTTAQFPLKGLPWEVIAGFGLPGLAAVAFLILVQLNRRFQPRSPSIKISATSNEELVSSLETHQIIEFIEASTVFPETKSSKEDRIESQPSIKSQSTDIKNEI